MTQPLATGRNVERPHPHRLGIVNIHKVFFVACCLCSNQSVFGFLSSSSNARAISTTKRFSTSGAFGAASGMKTSSGEREVGSLTKWATDNSFQISDKVSIASTDNIVNDYGVAFKPGQHPSNQQQVQQPVRRRQPQIDQPKAPQRLQMKQQQLQQQMAREATKPTASRVLTVPKSFVFDSKAIYEQEWAQLSTSTAPSSPWSGGQKTKKELIGPALQHIRSDGNFNQYINHFILIVKLYQEYKLQDRSKWYSWMQSLPQNNQDFDTGVNMDDVEIDCLPPFALALANHEKEKLNLFYDAFQKVPMDAFFGSGVNANDKELFTWLFNVVHTRCWTYEADTNGEDMTSSNPIIVPMGDMFNHREPANIFVQDSSSSGDVEFVYSNESEIQAVDNGDMNIMDVVNNNGLFLSYGLTNPHRFLIIFGFCDTSMPEIFSQLIFNNPSKEMIALNCNDRSKMVYRSADGAIPNPIWDCVLYTLLDQVPQEQKLFYEAHVKRDIPTLRMLQEKYLLEIAMTLRPHVINNVKEQADLLLKIDAIVQKVEASSRLVDQVHPRLMMIRKHNLFLYGVFDKVRQRLDNIAEAEVKKRKDGQAAQVQR